MELVTTAEPIEGQHLLSGRDDDRPGVVSADTDSYNLVLGGLLYLPVTTYHVPNSYGIISEDPFFRLPHMVMKKAVRRKPHGYTPKRLRTRGGTTRINAFMLTLPIFLCSGFYIPPVNAQDSSENATFDRVITVGVKPGRMKYDTEEFRVPAGGHIKLILDNSDGTLKHNLLIRTPGDENAAIELARQAGNMENPSENGYVPDSEDVLFATPLLNPGEKKTITFTAPEQPGDHPYVCTVPGHARTMNGMMHVRTPEGEEGSGETGDQESGGDAPSEVSLENLTYRYYEGKWEKLPAFDELEPVDSGNVPDGKISLAPRKRDKNYGIVFEGTLTLQADGSYQFYLASDDGSRLILNGESIVDNDGTHGVQTRSGTANLTAGTHDLRLEFFQAQGGAGVQMALFPPGRTQVNLSENFGAIDDLISFRINPSSSPRVFRVRMPDAPPRAVAVGLPSRVHYCFDPTEGYVRYAWSGHFLNVGPERGNGRGRGGKECQILGERYRLGMVEHGQPLRFGTPDRKPEFSFRGYIRHGDAPPTLMYTLDGVKVRQQVRARDGERGVELRYRVDSVPDKKMFFRVDRRVVDVSVSQGEWVNDSTLALPGEKTFRISLAPTN